MMTPKQKAVLGFIEGFASENGYAPSQHEIARHFGFRSLGTVQNYLVRLERHGLLRKTWNARRGTEVVGTGGATITLPLVGRVAAGRPIEAITSRETLEVPASMVPARRDEHFVLRVVGDSMIDDGILSGDLVVIRKTPEATNGQTVVALLGNEATIKRFYRRRNTIELHPANPAYKPLVIHSLIDSGFKIEGVLVGLIRRLE